MTGIRRSCGFFALLLGAGLLAGCQSTQSRSEEIAAKLGPVKEEKGLEIKQESKVVEVGETTLLSDANGTAVVVEVENTSDETLVNVPLAIDVLDAKGNSIFSNAAAGISQPSLTSVPVLMPGEKLDWVNDQVFPAGDPKEVEVTIGEAETLSEDLPDIGVNEPELQNDPVSGIFAAGTAVNKTDEQEERLEIFGVARDGDEVVAAGRAAIEQLNPGRSKGYRIYFIGDPKGAEITVTSFPLLAEEATGGSNG